MSPFIPEGNDELLVHKYNSSIWFIPPYQTLFHWKNTLDFRPFYISKANIFHRCIKFKYELWETVVKHKALCESYRVLAKNYSFYNRSFIDLTKNFMLYEFVEVDTSYTDKKYSLSPYIDWYKVIFQWNKVWYDGINHMLKLCLYTSRLSFHFKINRDKENFYKKTLE